MSGQIAGTSSLSLELVAAIVVISMIVGAIDLVRQPGWAWKRAEESKAAWLVLVALVPLVGLGMYLHSARPKVASIAAAGRAASLPFEHFGNDVGTQRDTTWPIGAVAPPQRFVKVGATVATDGEIRLVEAAEDGHGATWAGNEFTSASSRSPVPVPCMAETGYGSPRPNSKNSAALDRNLSFSHLFTTTNMGGQRWPSTFF